MVKENCLIIAEAGVNHNGKLALALQLCDAAKEAGADVIKFQTWNTESLLTKSVKQAEYQTHNTGKQESQFDMLKRLELSYGDFCIIKQYCESIGILFASTADDPGSLDFLVALGIPFIKVGSGDIGNVSFLRYIGSKGLPVILSTGISTLGDVDLSINALKEGGATDISLLHCTTSYPCPYESVNLRAMLTMREAFHLPVGYSDHTIGNEVAISAVSLGASIIEKHLTLDCKMKGPDHAASTEPGAFSKLVKAIRIVEASLGSGIKEPTATEKSISEAVTKRIVARTDITSGDLLTEDNLCVKRSNEGELARYWDVMCGRRAERDYLKDEGICL